MFINWNVPHPTQRRKPEPPTWQQPRRTASKGVDHSPTLSEPQPSLHTAIGKPTIRRFNSQQMRSLVGGVTVRLVAESLGVAATFPQWFGFSLIDDGNPAIHAEHSRIRWTSSETQRRFPISMIRPMTKMPESIVIHWLEPPSFYVVLSISPWIYVNFTTSASSSLKTIVFSRFLPRRVWCPPLIATTSLAML